MSLVRNAAPAFHPMGLCCSPCPISPDWSAISGTQTSWRCSSAPPNSIRLCHSPVRQAGGTQTFEVHFDSPDGTDADTSVDAAAAARAEAERIEKEKKAKMAAQADEVNTTPGERYHVICSLGAGIYTQWQSRVVSACVRAFSRRRAGGRG